LNLLGLIGNPVSHSRSPEIFHTFFQHQNLSDWEYKLFPLESVLDFSNLLNDHPSLIGLNVTIPYKQTIIPFLDELTPEAKFIGAVNTILIVKNNEENRLQGFNTDAFGFEKSLTNWKLSPDTTALILGTGGSSKAVQFVLKKLKIPFKIVGRNANQADLNYLELNKSTIQNFNLIVQTTPLGMFPNLDSTPSIPYQYITPDHSCFDLIYNPIKTKFLELAEKNGASIKNGSQMLQFQAERAWELFYSNSNPS
jgi:shikimate dehydrogenase